MIPDSRGRCFSNLLRNGGEETDEERPDPNAPDDEGGPYVVTTASEEFGREPDESNPEDAEPAPFPITQSES